MFNIEAIFAVPNTGGALYTCRFKGLDYEGESDNELYKAFRNWGDPEYLEAFFREHLNDLYYFENYPTPVWAMLETQDYAKNLARKFFTALTAAEDGDLAPLRQLFTSVDKEPWRTEYVEHKIKQEWLRLFGVKTDSDVFIITGGAIKLTTALQDRKHTHDELKKTREMVRYLFSRDEDQLYEIFEITV